MFKLLLSAILLSILAISSELTQMDKNIALRYTLYLTEKISNKPKAPDGVDINITEVEDWRMSFAIPSKETLKYFGVGFNDNDFSKIYKSKFAYAIKAKFKQIKTLKHHKDLDDYLYKITKNNNGYIYDEATREMFKASSWQKRRIIEGWIDGQIAIDKHIIIHYYQIRPKVYRLITLGMAKFGLPDIVIEDVFPRKASDLSSLIKLTAYELLNNNDIKKSITINLDKLALKYEYAKYLKKYRYKNHKKAIILGFKKATKDEGDPDNRLIELTFNSKKGENIYATQARYLIDLFGSDDKVFVTNAYRDEMLAASKKDLAMLPEIKRIFNNKLKLNEYIEVKAPFKYSDGREWMWVLVTSWKGDKIEGILNNKPYYIKNLHSGDKVIVNEKDIFDFVYHIVDGTEIGNETTKVILKYNKQ